MTIRMRAPPPMPMPPAATHPGSPPARVVPSRGPVAALVRVRVLARASLLLVLVLGGANLPLPAQTAFPKPRPPVASRQQGLH